MEPMPVQEGDVVFVLGAGASVPFGFPTGAELNSRLLKITKADLPKLFDGSECADLAGQFHVDSKLLAQFQTTLRRSQVNSIDAFLSKSIAAQFVEVGKLMIAAVLIPCERRGVLLESDAAPNQNWYKLLWNAMLPRLDSARSLGHCGYRFITFNYDRSLEQYFSTVLRVLNVSADDLVAFSERIIHVHGALGAHPITGFPVSRRYSSKASLRDIESAARGIKVHHEVGRFPEQRSIREWLMHAGRIVFLGFAYQEDNVRKLFSGSGDVRAKIQGSSFGLTEVDAASARLLIANVAGQSAQDIEIGGDPNLGCHDYLRHRVPLN